MEVTRHDTEDLAKLCAYLVERVREEEKNCIAEGIYWIGQDENTEPANFSRIHSFGNEGMKAMEALSQYYPGLSGAFPYPKPLIFSRILSIQQLTGVYSPFTLEANYNRDIPYYNLPFTICHELSHLRGYMQEDEANFISFLACTRSENAYFRYSGYLSAFVYSGNALAKVDIERYSRIYSELVECAKKDLDYNNRFWKSYESKVSEAAEKVNDSYLKANGQKEGVKSYGMVVDLILEYYLRDT